MHQVNALYSQDLSGVRVFQAYQCQENVRKIILGEKLTTSKKNKYTPGSVPKNFWYFQRLPEAIFGILFRPAGVAVIQNICKTTSV